MRFLLSLLLGFAVGVVGGLYVGWVAAPAQSINHPAAALDRSYRDQYTVWVAAGFLLDSDLQGALDRLRVLGVENAPAHVLEITERFITNSQNVDDIRKLVALYQGLTGRLTPLMEAYRPVSLPGTTP